MVENYLKFVIIHSSLNQEKAYMAQLKMYILFITTLFLYGFSQNEKNKVLITTSKFAEFDSSPLELLEANNFEYKLNPFERKLTKELLSLQPSCNCLLAGLEILDEEIFLKVKV